MRRASAVLLLLAAACAGPKPCTRSLCLEKLEGTLESTGWSGTVASTPTSPKPPVLSDTDVKVVYGSAAFRHGKTKVEATEGTAFRFSVSTRALASIEVTAGVVTVTASTGAPVSVVPGAPYVLPTSK